MLAHNGSIKGHSTYQSTKEKPMNIFSFLKNQFGGKGAKWSIPFLIALLLGIGAILLLPSARDQQTYSLFCAGAALAVGALLGFLFGIPRAAQEGSPPPTALTRPTTSYRANTNLEQISDWLTKIIVGISLVQYKEVAAGFELLAAEIAKGYTAGPLSTSPLVPAAFVKVMLVFFTITGFLISYLWTRIRLAQEFSWADGAQDTPEYYEGMVNALLYQAPPEGFTKTLQATDDYLEKFGPGNWRIWRAIACANGQKYSFLKDQNPNDPALPEVRQQALTATKRVIDLSGEANSMRTLWDPNQGSPYENDLAVFFDDPEFARLFAARR